jgi:signal transduction histidine kinase
MGENPRILIVDDEPRSVELLVRTLRRVGTLDTATSGDEGWEIARRTPPDLVISDQRMAGMQGVELLGRISEIDARIGRVLITGYADIGATIDAINRGRVHSYVTKPWQPEQVLALAKQLLESLRLGRENERLLRELTERNEELEDALRATAVAQRRAIDAERLAAIGRMSAMIAHDFRSPLTVVRAAASEISREGTNLGDDEIRTLAGGALEEADRMARLCSDLLEATRASEHRLDAMESEDLDEWVDSVVGSKLEDAAQRGVQVDLALASGAQLLLDADRMRRALVNLIENALDAMPDGGTLRVETALDCGTACIRVVDDGSGIPLEIAETLFDPFVTAGKRNGTGLGLAVVRKVVEDHRGVVSVAKPPGGGTAFELRLPQDPVG